MAIMVRVHVRKRNTTVSFRNTFATEKPWGTGKKEGVGEKKGRKFTPCVTPKNWVADQKTPRRSQRGGGYWWGRKKGKERQGPT